MHALCYSGGYYTRPSRVQRTPGHSPESGRCGTHEKKRSMVKLGDKAWLDVVPFWPLFS